jgi:hypothetical protein
MRTPLGGHERPLCGEANVRFSPVRAAARPPTHANTASDCHRRERIPCLDRPAPGTPSSRIPGHASGRHRGGNRIAGNALGRCRGPRIRPLSRPTTLRRNASERHPRHRPRTPSHPAGRHVPPARCRPTSACSPTPFRRRDRADVPWYHDVKAFPTYRCGAADAQAVGRQPSYASNMATSSQATV